MFTESRVMMDFEHFPIPETIRPYAPFIMSLLSAILILTMGWMLSKWANRLVKKLLDKTPTDEALSRFISTIVRYAVLAFTLIAALNRVGVATASLVAILASAGLAVGLALQGSLSNFASGVLILALRPFMLSDYVSVGGKSGTVDDIGLFMTRLITPSNETVLVPNSKVTGDSIVNHTSRGVRRCTIEVGIAHGQDARKVRKILEKVVADDELCLEEPAPAVVLTKIGSSALYYDIYAFAKNADFWPMIYELTFKVYETLEREGIDSPPDHFIVHRVEKTNSES